MCPVANSYVAAAAREAGSVAELAAVRKSAKYTNNLDPRYTFSPIAIETLGLINDTAREFLLNLGRKLSLSSGDDRGAIFSFSDSLF